MNPHPKAEWRARVVLLLGAIGVAAGVALCGSLGGHGVGGIALIAGWLTLIVGIHRFGRLGSPEGRAPPSAARH
jgi:hypothetical protein